MDLGAIIEVAIGLIFVWIVLSLAIIQIQEWINTRLDKRAKDMEAAIYEMLANPNLKSQFYDHPIIRGLTAKKRNQPSRVPSWLYNNPLVRGFLEQKRKIPSYIPSQQFSLALFDVAMTAGTESSLIQQGILKVRDNLENDKKISIEQAVIDELNLLSGLARSAAATEAGTAVTNVTLSVLKKELANFAERRPEFKGVMEATLEEADRLKSQIDDVMEKQPKTKADDPLLQLRRGVAALSVISPEVNQTLNALMLNVEQYVTEGETTLAKARENVEAWFNDSMDRVSGAFKRYSENIALILGLILALLLNVDSINLSIYLWRDPTVRQALVQNAAEFQLPQSQFETNPEQAMQNFREQFVGLSLPIGWVINDSRGAAFSDANCQLFPGEKQGFGIPVFASNHCIAPPQTNNQTNLGLKLIGFLITAFAARLGAPFWFDVLKRLVNLRSTGINPDEKPAG